MIFVEDRLLFVTCDGHLGSVDLKLEIWNLNFALRDVSFILLNDDVDADDDGVVPQSTRVRLDAPIEIGSNAELSWRVNSELATQRQKSPMILYKIQLFRDNFGGDRTVDLSLTNKFALPKSLLDVWTSRQKFDVQIDAITPWTITSINRTAVLAPTKPPSPPTNLRIFATQQVGFRIKSIEATQIVFFSRKPSTEPARSSICFGKNQRSGTAT